MSESPSKTDPVADMLRQIERGELVELIDQLDPDFLQKKLMQLDEQARACKVLLKAARARRRWHARQSAQANGEPIHAA